MCIPNSPRPPSGITCSLFIKCLWPDPCGNFFMGWNCLRTGEMATQRSSLAANLMHKSSVPEEVPQKRKCSPAKVSISYPLFYQGDVRWENHFRRHRNRQKLSDWILNSRRHSSQVKHQKPQIALEGAETPELNGF